MKMVHFLSLLCGSQVTVNGLVLTPTQTVTTQRLQQLQDTHPIVLFAWDSNPTVRYNLFVRSDSVFLKETCVSRMIHGFLSTSPTSITVVKISFKKQMSYSSNTRHKRNLFASIKCELEEKKERIM